jgi:adenosylmethionine-8-amino-7-oxononanoate aminotransferase
MIYIIGTRHRFQVWAEAIRTGESLDVRKEHVEAFENYLTDVARSLKADMIAEEASEDWVVTHGHGASSVAKDITKQLGKQHLFCNPTKSQHDALGLKIGGRPRR